MSPNNPTRALVGLRNKGLAARGIPHRIEIRGARLTLRGPLPCRQGSGSRPIQRLSTGLPATPEGLDQAVTQLDTVLAQLARGRFRWESWSRRRLGDGRPVKPLPSQVKSLHLSVADRLEAFENAFFVDPRRRRQPSGSRTTWIAAYRPYLRRLASVAESSNRPLSQALIIDVLESYVLASRSRQQCGIALAALARHQDITLPPDWSERSGGYGIHAARFRRLPSDVQILEMVERIPNPRWRLAYGLMATYGLRNHEIFFADLSALVAGGDRIIRVLPASKTGEHQIWPFHPGWVERFDLVSLAAGLEALPKVRIDLRRTTLQQVGRRVAEQFRRYKLPITPYDLRHAWAVRTIHIGLPDTVAARMMGHSVAIHTRTYHHWITRRDQQQAVDSALARWNGGPNDQSEPLNMESRK